MSQGHLFIVRGDLTTVASDAALVPTDRACNITQHWWHLFRSEDLEDSYGGWKRFVGPAEGLRSGAVRLYQGRYWLFSAAHSEPSALAEHVAAAVQVAAAGITAGGGRVRPLVSLPLPGTGAGGLTHRRGAVVEHLLPVLRVAAQAHGVDVALVLADDRDAAAVQRSRSYGYWDALPAELHEPADVLGERAAAGRLSLFIGAGVSTSLGLPDWDGLVGGLRQEAGLGPTSASAPDAAQEAADVLGEQAVLDRVSAVFDVRECTLAHALLADLRIREAVTTNYDTAYEVAVNGLHRQTDGAVKVLTRTVVDPDRPWLLKLHGDARSGRGIVLTRAQYAEFEARGVPLRGMVQSLLMTGHLMFVGYSLVDETFALLAQQVRDVLTDSDEPRGQVGTVLPVAEDAHLRERCGDDLAYLPMPVDPSQAAEGARLLGIFLDRVAWRASQGRLDSLQYLLDDRYAEVQRTPEDDKLKELAREVLSRSGAGARRSAGWQHFVTALRRLGADV